MIARHPDLPEGVRRDAREVVDALERVALLEQRLQEITIAASEFHDLWRQVEDGMVSFDLRAQTAVDFEAAERRLRKLLEAWR